MAKDPAFLFYPGDWLGGTIGMTFEEKGAYIELLVLQFNRGHMTEDMIGHVLGQRFGQIWLKLEDKFQKDENGMYFNARLDEEKEKRKKFVISRVNNKTGKNQYTKTEGHMLGQMTSHMENENEDYIILSKEVSLKGGYGGKTLVVGEFFSDAEDALRMSDGTFMKISENTKSLIKGRQVPPFKIVKKII